MKSEKQRNVEKFIEKCLANGASQSAFDKIANYLLKKCQLRIENNAYYFTEIEFYCHELTGAWKDTSIYAVKYENDSKRQIEWKRATEMQSQLGYFFEHGSGIDFTFGKAKIRYGGILIRGIAPQKEKNDNSELQSQPTKVWKKFKDIPFEKWNTSITIEENNNEKNITIFQGPRINIDDYRPLRYAIDLNRKDKEGLVFSSFLCGKLKNGDVLLGTSYEKWWKIYKSIIKQ